MKLFLISILILSTRAFSGQTTVMSPAAIEARLHMARWTVAAPSFVETNVKLNISALADIRRKTITTFTTNDQRQGFVIELKNGEVATITEEASETPVDGN